MKTVQYTIRNVPVATDRELRQRARQSGRSLNQVALEAINLGAIGTPTASEAANETFDWLYGVNTLDDDFDAAIAEQSKIDPEQWS